MTRPVRFTHSTELSKSKSLAGIALSALMLLNVGFAKATTAPAVRIGVPSWAGATMLSQVTADILDVAGYPMSQSTPSPTVILKGIASDALGVCLAGWVPTEKPPDGPQNSAMKITNGTQPWLGPRAAGHHGAHQTQQHPRETKAAVEPILRFGQVTPRVFALLERVVAPTDMPFDVGKYHE